MALVESSFADWLKSDALKAVTAPAGLDSWGDVSAKSNISSCLTGMAEAQAEAERQASFLAGPRVIEKLRVPGRRLDLIGRCVSLIANWPGYETGAVVFVLSVDEIEGDDGSQIKVIRRLT